MISTTDGSGGGGGGPVAVGAAAVVVVAAVDDRQRKRPATRASTVAWRHVMTKVDGRQQCNNQPTKGSAKAGGGGGSNSNSNRSGEDGNGNATALVMDSNGWWDGNGNGAGKGWHNGNVTATWRQLTVQQHLQYMEQRQRDGDDSNGQREGGSDGNDNGRHSGNSNVRRDGNAGVATTMDGTTAMQLQQRQWAGQRRRQGKLNQVISEVFT